MKWYGAHQVFVSCIEYIDSRKHFVCLVHLWRLNMNEVMIGILVPFLGTSLGSACVFFMKKNMSDYLQRALTGFAAGVMVAASIWSLLLPAIEQSASMGKFSFVPAVVGF